MEQIVKSRFYPLNVRSEYSLLASALRLNSYADKLKSQGYEGGAVADYNNLFCYGKLDREFSSRKLKPIYGLTVSLDIVSSIVEVSLYVLNEEGYSNLLKLINLSHKEVYTLDDFKFGQGLALVIHSKANGALKLDSYEENIFSKLKKTFTQFYIGIEIYSEDDVSYSDKLRARAKELYYDVIAFPEILYPNKKDHGTYEVLKAIKDDGHVENPEVDGPYFLLGIKAVTSLYSEEEISNTSKLADAADFTFLKKRGSILKFNKDYQMSVKLLEEQVTLGLNKKSLVSTKYTERAKYELKIIADMGFADYFLIVQDYVNFAKDSGIYVGPGRGSAAGSLVSYALNITEVDPLVYNLSFERFLNPLRISMPDIDMDFEDGRREEVIDYLKKRYTERKVSNIITFNTLKLKSAIRQVGKVLNMIDSRVERISKLIGNKSKTFKQELETNYPLKEQYNDPYYKKLIDTASQVLDFPINTSIHAAGIILSSEPLDELIQVYDNKTGLEAGYLEELGFLKMDILALRNLSFIKNIETKIVASGNQKVDISKHLDDKESLTVLQNCLTMSIFQLESYGIQEAIKTIQPDGFKDLVALLALYRPGPMDNIPQYAKSKKTGIIPSTGYPALDEELKETYGIIVYQEQILKIVQIVAKFSAGEADLLRRAISKKDINKMNVFKDKFIKGAVSNDYKEQDAINIYNLILKFANYGFNKSHSVAYALITMQLLYYKAHYPLFFYSCLLNEITPSSNEFLYVLNEIKHFKIKVCNPDINISTDECVIKNNSIYLPLKTIDGLTPIIRSVILTARDSKKGRFNKLSSVLSSISTKMDLDMKTYRSLVSSGSLDSYGYTRTGLLEKCEQFITDSRYMLGDEDLQADSSRDVINEFIKEKAILGAVISTNIQDIYKPKEGYMQFIAISDLIKLNNGYKVVATDGIKEVSIFTKSIQDIKCYDLLHIKGYYNKRRLTIDADEIIKENI